MKAFLIKERSIHFRIRKCGDNPDIRQGVVELQINSECIVPHISEGLVAGALDESSVDLCKKLKTIFSSPDGRIIDRYASLSIQNTSRGSDLGQESVKFRLHLQGGILQEIKNLLGDKVQITMRLDNLHHEESLYPSTVSGSICDTSASTHDGSHSSRDSNWTPGMISGNFEVSTKEMNVLISPVTHYFEDLVNFPESWVQSWCNYIDWMYWEYMADVSVIVSVNQEMTGATRDNSQLATTSSAAGEILTVNKRILQDQLLTDMEIVASNGAVLRCHGIFLVAQSEILRSMLETQVNRISMDNMSEEGVKAFLAFLYCREKEEPMKNLMIALELLRAAFRYGIESLEFAMQTILLNAPFESFEMDAALSLFYFTNKIKKFKSLKFKAVKILKSKFGEISMSEFFSQFRDNREGAKELLDAFFESQ